MRLFVRIVETGSFAQAARALGMSASNATERMARLEQALGIKLLARTTRAVAPTPAGSRYFETCRRLLVELDDVEASLTDARGALAGRVRVSANTAIARAILLPRLPAWIERHPELHIELVMGERHEWEFEENGHTSPWHPPAVAAVGDANARVDLAIAGMGIVQTLYFIAAPALGAGQPERLLVPWETDAPEVSILYPRDRHLPARTRATMDAFAHWIRQALDEARPALARTSSSFAQSE